MKKFITASYVNKLILVSIIVVFVLFLLVTFVFKKTLSQIDDADAKRHELQEQVVDVIRLLDMAVHASHFQDYESAGQALNEFTKQYASLKNIFDVEIEGHDPLELIYNDLLDDVANRKPVLTGAYLDEIRQQEKYLFQEIDHSLHEEWNRAILNIPITLFLISLVAITVISVFFFWGRRYINDVNILTNTINTITKTEDTLIGDILVPKQAYWGPLFQKIDDFLALEQGQKKRLEADLSATVTELTAAISREKKVTKDKERLNDAMLNVLEDQAELLQKQERSEKRLRSILDNYVDSVVLVDSKLHVVYANSSFIRTMSVVDNPAGNAIADVLSSDLKIIGTEKYFVSTLAQNVGQNISFLDNIKLQLKSGNYDNRFLARVVESTAVEEENSYVIIMRDITHEEIEAEGKKEFVSVASHQLRTPINGLRWFMELLLSNDLGNLNNEQHDVVESAYESTWRMMRIVQKLLRTSTVDSESLSITPAKVNFKKVLSGLKRAWSDTIKRKKLKVKFTIDTDVETVFHDKTIVEDILDNLFENAIKYTYENGNVVVRISAAKRGHVKIEVQDDGIGIAKIERRHVFDKLFRGKNAIEHDPDGSGLGLHVVKKLVARINGKVSFTSGAKKGTTFTVILPKKYTA